MKIFEPKNIYEFTVKDLEEVMDELEDESNVRITKVKRNEIVDVFINNNNYIFSDVDWLIKSILRKSIKKILMEE